jgi:sugar-specific transcriptional regulator TrmB
MTTDETTAVDALERLGLSNYEAKVFIALQALGTGTARDVYQVSEIPRSQVYGAAESLAERGLIEVQHSTPMQYRPVSLEEARELLEERFERERTRAFEYLESVRNRRDAGEEREDIWSVDGTEHVHDRIEHLIAGANETVVFGAASTDLLTDEIRDRLFAAAEEGVDVVVVSEDPEVRSRFEDGSVTVYAPLESNERAARMVIVDDVAVLLSVRNGDGTAREDEAAIWSESSGFATVLAEILTGWLETSVIEE